VARPDPGELLGGAPGESTAEVAGRVALARERARQRGVRCNAELSASALDDLAPMAPDALRLVDGALRSGTLSGRGLHRVRRVARTLADLAGRDDPVTAEDVGLALQLRAEPEAMGVAA
jgi:magnesium chelatase family protein